MSKIRTILPKLFISVLLLLSSTPVKAQITPDNTLGAERSVFTTNTLIQGKNINADLITGGAQRGRNLFHSFSDFNVSAGQSVYFANPSDVTNILTRVTGGNQSNILGTLGVDGTANLFLINPAGILFGKGATLDLKGSFVGTTANGVQFGNLGSFSATNPQAPPPLLTIDPSALLFNQLNQQGITVTNQSIGASLTNLQVQQGKSLVLAGGDVVLDGGGLTASGGHVELASLAAPGTIGLNVAGDTLSLSVPSNVQRGNVSLQNQAKVDVSGAAAGDIAVNAGKLDLSNSYLFAENLPGAGNSSTKAGDININADSISLSNGAQIDTFTNGIGNAGNITIVAKGAVNVDGLDSNQNYSGIFSIVKAGGVGNGGLVDITAGSLSLSNGGEINTSVESASGNLTAGQGTGGRINIKVGDTLTISGTDSQGIFANLDSGAKGRAGDINIQAGNILVKDGGQINSFTSGTGDAGNITLVARDAVTFDGVNSNGDNSGVFSDVEAGGVANGGNINITAGSLSLTNGGVIDTEVKSASDNLPAGHGNGGTVNVIVGDALTISGTNSGIFGDLNAGAVGRGGDIKLLAGNIFLTDGGTISSSTLGQGDAGNISITANEGISLAGNNSTIVSNVQSSDAVGNAGNIDINTGSLSVQSGGQINSFTRGHGNAGNITITAKNAVSFDGVDSNGDHSGVFNDVLASGVGNGGNINITTGSLSLTNGAIIGSSVQSSDAVGNAGNIDISTGSLSVQSGSQINSFTRGQGNAGNITITAKNAVTFDGVYSNGDHSGVFSTVDSSGVGNGGNINITAGSLSLTNGGELLGDISSTSGNVAANQGIGGNINVNVGDALTISGTDSQISAILDTGAVGRGGNIKVQSGNIFLTDGGTITSSTFGKGDAGNISITVHDGISLEQNAFIVSNVESSDAVGKAGNIDINTGSLSVKDGSQINSFTRGQGNAGNITITAKNAVTFDGVYSNGDHSGVFSDVEATGVGNGGNINITAGSLSLTNGGELVGSVFSSSGNVAANQGIGGSINVNVGDALTISGKDTGIGAVLASGAVGRGGNIKVQSGNIFLTDGGTITSSTLGQGDAGNISITANEGISLAGNNSTIVSNVQSSDAVGNAGNIDINTGSLSVQSGGQINSFTRGHGNAGNITITAKNAVSFDGVDSGSFSDVEPNGSGLGNSGKIDITARSFALTNGAQLVVSFLGNTQGIAGDIIIKANSVNLNKGQIIAQTISGNGGNIILNLSDYLLLRNGSKISTNAGTANRGGDGGSITINTPFIVAVPNENSDITANAFSGSGGQININAQLFGIEPRQQPSDQTNDITAFSQQGVQGQIVTTQPQVDLVSGLVAPPIQLSDATTQFSQLCPNTANPIKKPLGSFVITGKGSIPPNPLELLPGRNPDIPLANAEDMQEIKNIQAQEQKKKEEQEHSSKVGRKKNKDKPLPSIVEAQGIVQTPDGQIYFVANANHATPSSQPTASPCPSQK